MSPNICVSFEVPLEYCDKIASGNELVAMRKWNLGGGLPLWGLEPDIRC